MAGRILCAHQRQTKGIDSRLGQRQTDQATAMGGHEVDHLRRAHLGGNTDIALIFPVFMIDKNIHATIAGIFDDLFDRRDGVGI